MSAEYHKIQSLFKRDMTAPGKPLIEGEWTLPEFEYLADNQWEFTEKVDGTNVRIIYNGPHAGEIDEPEIEFAGREETSILPPKLVEALKAHFSPLGELLHQTFPKGAVLYGEGYGAGIQKAGRLYREDQHFVLFDVRVGDWWLSRVSVEGIADTLGLGVVPVIARGTLHDAVAMAKQGIVSRWGGFPAEGIVARPVVPMHTRAGERIIAKIKSRDFPR